MAYIDENSHQTYNLFNSNFPVLLWHGMRGRSDTSDALHWHEHLELWYLRKGSVTFEINNTCTTVKVGELIVVNGYEMHSVYYNTAETLYDCIILSPAFMRSDIGRQNLNGNIPYKRINIRTNGRKDADSSILKLKNHIADKNIEGYFDRIVSECSVQDTMFDMATRAIICELLVYLHRNYSADTSDITHKSIHSAPLYRISPALNYINKNYAIDISIDHLARICDMSKQYFCKVFRTQTKRNVIDYINDLRISSSEPLLTNSNMPVTSIAFEIGFSDANYFSRLFKRKNGASPTEFRRLSTK